jgi:hypothetical protein
MLITPRAGSLFHAVFQFDGVYFGERVLTKGSGDTTCPSEDGVSVTIHGETLYLPTVPCGTLA